MVGWVWIRGIGLDHGKIDHRDQIHGDPNNDTIEGHDLLKSGHGCSFKI